MRIDPIYDTQFYKDDMRLGIQVYCCDMAEWCKQIASNDGEVNVIVTSPPYWNQREYSYWPTYAEYLDDVSLWVQSCYAVLESGRHCFWIIPDKLPWPPSKNGTKERLYFPIYSDAERLASQAGFVCKYPIVWKKPHGSQKMFGSYPYPPTTIHTPFTERICVWRKPGKYLKRSKETKERSTYTKEQWVSWGTDYWEVNPKRSKTHPAPFPNEIIRRILTLWAFKGDVVFDPFLGSGSTLETCVELGMSGVGTEINIDYCKKSAIPNIELALAKSRQIPMF